MGYQAMTHIFLNNVMTRGSHRTPNIGLPCKLSDHGGNRSSIADFLLGKAIRIRVVNHFK